MPTSMRITGLDELIVELTAAESRLLPEVTAVIGRGALNIKKDWQAAWRGFKHLGAVPYSIGYDVFTLPGSIRAEIGPDINKKQGNIAFVLENGSPTSAPHPGGTPALDREAPKTEAALLKLTETLLP